MKIISWNVNGLRAAYRKDFLKSFKKIKGDVFCLQELRAEFDQIPEELKEIKGYKSFFNPSQLKKGHSGTAIYTLVEPEKVSYEIGWEKFDKEGRVIRLDFKDFVLFNLYMPQGGRKKENFPHKFESYDYLIKYLKKIKKPFIITGDFNIAHKEIDLARPKDNKNNTGFTPEERERIEELVDMGLVDSFREFNKEGGNYTWWSNFNQARERNIGWRIDYFFVSKDLKKKMKDSFILPKVYGSDHCPIGIEI